MLIMQDKTISNRKIISYSFHARKSKTVQNSPENSAQKLSSACFTSILKPKRLYGNIHLFAQVLHKQIRAKTISDNFQRTSSLLHQNFCAYKGFKGNKVKIYSGNKHQKIQHPPPYTATETQSRKQQQKLIQAENKNVFWHVDRSHSRQKVRPNLNININIYRKKYRQKHMTKQNSPRNKDLGQNISGIAIKNNNRSSQINKIKYNETF